MNSKFLIFKRTWREFSSAPTLYLISTLIIAFCITIFSFFALLYINLEHFTNLLARELVLNVYLEPGTTNKDCKKLIDDLLSCPEVMEVRFLSSEQVLKDMRSLFEDKNLLVGVSADFLPPVLEVAFKRPFQALDRLPQFAEKISRYPKVLRVQYAKSWLKRLTGIKHFLEIISVTGLLLLGVATAFITGATVRLSLVPKSKELEILSLVGATPGFIQGPLMIIALFQSIIAFSWAMSFLWILHSYLGQVLHGIFPGMKTKLLFFGFKEMTILFGGVLIFCLSGCYWASLRFLRY